ncbi:sporulation peptidase YabG [Marinisporobacter balticus]|uniref:Spore coat assembly protein n=1 Tax=Marinisporobacter balticus TaxID=2018667 RepID=A0A4R2KZR6_9FIRM|nr:sporulation peptidase YabG [Marinisporobacter balticus]TCO78722.1 spore coat assembly protein [Marinisporobacter balticus]
MMNLRIGDLVARRSYGFDILFKIIDMIETFHKEKIVILKGVDLRIIADSPEKDLYRISLKKIDSFTRSFEKKIEKTIDKIMKKRNEKDEKKDYFIKSGKVLHLDGDKEYLDVCLKVYKQLEIDVVGKQIGEEEQPKAVLELLQTYGPDILVITGHDGFLKGHKDFKNADNYKNSRHFIETVKQARKYEPSMDDLVIFAGGCQSYYEEILNAGANFASSPHRVLMEWIV